MKKQLKRLLSCLVLCAVLTGSLTVSAGAAGFSDVPANHWAAKDIQRCVELGFFQGESATRFGLGHEMTRAAFTVVLCRFFGWETAKPTQPIYTDVPVNTCTPERSRPPTNTAPSPSSGRSSAPTPPSPGRSWR